MKKKQDRRKAPRNLDALLLRDLSPVEDVQGGTAKRLFGERAADPDPRKGPPRVSRTRKVPKD